MAGAPVSFLNHIKYHHLLFSVDLEVTSCELHCISALVPKKKHTLKSKIPFHTYCCERGVCLGRI